MHKVLTVKIFYCQKTGKHQQTFFNCENEASKECFTVVLLNCENEACKECFTVVLLN